MDGYLTLSDRAFWAFRDLFLEPKSTCWSMYYTRGVRAINKIGQYWEVSFWTKEDRDAAIQLIHESAPNTEIVRSYP